MKEYFTEYVNKSLCISYNKANKNYTELTKEIVYENVNAISFIFYRVKMHKKSPKS